MFLSGLLVGASDYQEIAESEDVDGVDDGRREPGVLVRTEQGGVDHFKRGDGQAGDHVEECKTHLASHTGQERKRCTAQNRDER